MITVDVFRKADGKPVKGAKVSIGFDGIWSGGFTKHIYTDDRGSAHFETEGGRSGTIYVNGKAAKSGRITGKEIVYV